MQEAGEKPYKDEFTFLRMRTYSPSTAGLGRVKYMKLLCYFSARAQKRYKTA